MGKEEHVTDIIVTLKMESGDVIDLMLSKDDKKMLLSVLFNYFTDGFDFKTSHFLTPKTPEKEG